LRVKRESIGFIKIALSVLCKCLLSINHLAL
jgi:hypothetical protein